MYARLRCGGNLPLCVRGLGTRNPLLRYGIDTRCQKRHPTVRDAFSEALRAQNRLLLTLSLSRLFSKKRPLV